MRHTVSSPVHRWDLPFTDPRLLHRTKNPFRFGRLRLSIKPPICSARKTDRLPAKRKEPEEICSAGADRPLPQVCTLVSQFSWFNPDTALRLAYASVEAESSDLPPLPQRISSIRWIACRRVSAGVPPLRHSMAAVSLAQLTFGGGPIFIPCAHPGAMCARVIC